MVEIGIGSSQGISRSQMVWWVSVDLVGSWWVLADCIGSLGILALFGKSRWVLEGLARSGGVS